MYLNNCTLSVVINGHHQAAEYVSPMDRQTYIEGREGSEFVLKFTNNNSFRVLMIPSVDGLSIMDGKPASEDSGGYVVEANSTLTIPGWMLDGDTAAKFFFAGEKGGSYSEQSGHGSVNKGVIGVMVFKEKYQRPTPVFRSGFARGATKGLSSEMFGSASATLSSSAPMWSNASVNATSFTADNARGIAPSHENTSFTAEPETQLGTGFGAKTTFATTEVKFEKGDMIAMMILYYKDRRGLKKVGIELDNRGNMQTRPNPFPASTPGCQPPSGWNG